MLTGWISTRARSAARSRRSWKAAPATQAFASESELLGFTPEDRLIDWRAIADGFAHVEGDATDADEAGLRLWRRFVVDHFEPDDHA
jgi:hypothetical protein